MRHHLQGNIKVAIRATLPLLAILLGACGGGGGSSASPAGASASGSVISGSATKGPLKGASVCVYASDATSSNGRGAKIELAAGPLVTNGCQITGGDGSYTLTLPAGAPRNVVVVASGGSYCSDEQAVQTDGTCRSGSTLLTLPSDAELSAATTLPANDGNATLHLTPLSQAAWQNALARQTSFSQEFSNLRTSLSLSGTITSETAPSSSSELRGLLAQVASSIATGGSSNLTSAISTLSSGQIPANGPGAQACTGETTQESQLRCLLRANNVTQLEAPPTVSDALFNAGRDLFTSTLLSGTGSVSCSSCHATNNAGVETTLALHANLRGSPNSIHRNSPDLVNKVLGGRKFLFWDGRVALNSNGSFSTPAGNNLPSGLDSLLAAQALFPMLSRDEMLGYVPGSGSGTGENQTAGLVTDSVEANPAPVWQAIMSRVKANASLLSELKAAYPAVAEADLGIQHVANALAGFQTRRWNPARSTSNFHGYLAGTQDLSDSAKRGGILFFDKAGCHRCHTGPLLSDQKFHNIAAPQIGPGFGSGASATPKQDKGRYEISGNPADLYAFLTPSLWEVKVTAPYLHNGVYSSLEKTIRHHLDATTRSQAFRCASDAPTLGGTPLACRDNENAPALYADMIARLAPELRTPISLSDSEIADLIAFLNKLTDGAN